MRFEWDDDKNRTNIEKHGVSFEYAKHVFDNYTVHRADNRFPYGEVREVSIGMVENVTVVVVHTERDGACRIISARQANQREQGTYAKEIPKTIDTE